MEQYLIPVGMIVAVAFIASGLCIEPRIAFHHIDIGLCDFASLLKMDALQIDLLADMFIGILTE